MNRRSSSSCRFESCSAVPGWTTSTLPLLELVPLGLVALAHVDRERPVEDDEHLLLDRVDVAPADRARRIAEEVRARPRHRVRELGDEARVALARADATRARPAWKIVYATLAILSASAGACARSARPYRVRRCGRLRDRRGGRLREYLGVELSHLGGSEGERDPTDVHSCRCQLGEVVELGSANRKT